MKEINSENIQKETGAALWSISFVLILFITFLGNINGNGMHNGVATYYIGCDIGVASGSFLWGWAINSLGFFAAFMMAAFVLFTDTILSFFLIKSHRQEGKGTYERNQMS